MASSWYSVHPDDLKTIWECHDCGRKFFYHSDIAYHVGELGHSKVVSRDYSRKVRNAVFVRRSVSLSFRLGGRTSTLEVDCKFYPSTESLVYTNVSYSDKKLQSLIESRPEMMSKVDRYLRQLFHGQGLKGKSSRTG